MPRVCTRTRAHAHDLTLQLLHEKQRRERGEGGRETRMLHVRTHVRTEQWPRSVSIMLASCTASRFSRENISDRSIFHRRKKKIEFIYRHFRSFAQNYRQNKIILENRKEKKDKKKEKCTRRETVLFFPNAWAHNVKMLKDKEKGR